MFKKTMKFVLLPAAAAVVVACGGGGGTASNGGGAVGNSLSGVAAIGAPLSGAAITLTDARGTQRTTVADDNGNFSFSDMTGMVGPYQIMAVMNLGERTVTQYSLVATVNGAQTANVTQLTSAMAALVNNSGVLTSLTSAQLAALTPDAIDQAKQKILTTIKPLSDKIVMGSFDPVSTPFAANGTGADLLLDHLDLTVRSDQISLSNKMAVVSDGSVSLGHIGVVPKTGSPVAIQNDSTTTTSGFEGIQQAFENCFKESAAQRMVATNATTATLHASCDSIADPDYLHNGQNFKLRWAKPLKFVKFNSNTPSSGDTWKKTKFLRPEVRLRVSSSPEIIAVNFHFNDTDGNNYTIPELIKKMSDGSWKLYGNQRGVNAFAEAQLNYYQDLSKSPTGSDYNNINFSRVDSGFRFYVDPRTAFDAQGVADSSYVTDYTTSTGYKSNSIATYAAVRANALADSKSVVQCVVVTGPGKMVGNKWMGVFPSGLVLKVPFSSPTQDYVAIDRRLGTAEKQALDAVDMTSPLASRSVNGSLCGGGGSASTTLVSSSNYTVDIQALTNQVHPFTGQVDTAINGRDVKWNTGARYARIQPDAELTRELDNNPVFTFYVIDSNHKLVQKIKTRMLGELPPASLAAEIMNKKLASQMSVDTLRRYLDFDANGADVANDVTAVNAQWSTAPNAFGADLVGFYSEVQKTKTGLGLRSKAGANPGSIHAGSRDNGSGSVIASNFSGGVWQSYNESTLWESDDDLAVDIDALPGTNFFWRWSEFARSLNSGQTVCNTTNAPSTNTLVSSQNVGVARSTNQLSGSVLASKYYGTSTLNNACLDWYSPSRPADKAYLHREVWMRTYTDKNVRFYSYTANKAFR